MAEYAPLMWATHVSVNGIEHYNYIIQDQCWILNSVTKPKATYSIFNNRCFLFTRQWKMRKKVTYSSYSSKGLSLSSYRHFSRYCNNSTNSRFRLGYHIDERQIFVPQAEFNALNCYAHSGSLPNWTKFTVLNMTYDNTIFCCFFFEVPRHKQFLNGIPFSNNTLLGRCMRLFMFYYFYFRIIEPISVK